MGLFLFNTTLRRPSTDISLKARSKKATDLRSEVSDKLNETAAYLYIRSLLLSDKDPPSEQKMPSELVEGSPYGKPRYLKKP